MKNSNTIPDSTFIPQPSSSAPTYWRGLEDLAESVAFQEMVRREFPDAADQWSDPVTRRQFLLLMGASFALAGMTGCTSSQPPVGKIVPYVRQPEGVTPGKPLYFATAMTLGGAATGLLVESHEGRPTKVEGNPQHPASLGATDVFAQASILGLYDPDRSQTVTYRGRPRAWSECQEALRKVMEKQRQTGGKGLRILTELVASPTLADQLAGKRPAALLQQFPNARWDQWEPVSHANALEGTKLAFGQYVNPRYDFTKAEVVLSLDADFLGCGPGHLRYVREFMSRRVPGRAANAAAMNRLYVIESMPTVTGAVADHRLPIQSRQIENAARALAEQLGMHGPSPAPGLSENARRWIKAVADDLKQHRGSGLVLAGDGQPALVHALAHAINNALGSVGKTVTYTDAAVAQPSADVLDGMVRDLKAGEIEVLFVLGGNPVFAAPADLEFDKHMRRAPLIVHLGLYQDETAALCHWHIPQAHFLESWSDARVADGTASIVQPLIAPLYGGMSAHELVSFLATGAERSGYEIVRDYWQEQHTRIGAKTNTANFDRFWEGAVHDGVIAGSELPQRNDLQLRTTWTNQPAASAAGEGLEIVFRPDPTIYDGRFANNGWLQELPKPITKLTWDNAVFMSPGTAAKLGLAQTFGGRGGEHGQALVDVVELTLDGRSVKGPVWILPGHADDSVTVHFGHGRTRAGKIGTGKGFNAYQLRTSKAPWFANGVQIRKTGEIYTLACTQMHHAMEGRDPVRAGTLAEFRRDSAFAIRRGGPKEEEHQRELVPGVGRPAEDGHSDENGDRRLHPLTMFPLHDYDPPKNKWAMAIDLSRCVGCNACVIACQAENNIPVVGKSEVIRGREMHWLRIDRYYAGDPAVPESLQTYFQPVPCMHCENAPCELVCPVAATAHSAEGLNDMVYNRCVGTRYCSNNCPYKVRRFNFLQYADYATRSLRLGQNPEVTVRSRGVMEKCTYCVQRIRAAQIEAEIQNRPIRDGDVLTACQASCPAEAIVFGDMNDAKSQVAQRKADPRHYGLLAELNTRPRTTYLAALRNPNPDL